MSGTTGMAPPTWRLRERWLEATFLAGLGSVFLANALIALLQPSDFITLVEQSAVGRWLGLDAGSWLALVICLNDLTLGIALFTAVWSRRIRPAVLAWAGIWFFAVTAIRVSSLNAFP